MNKVLGVALMVGQYVCSAAGLLLFVYLLHKSSDPSVDVRSFNVWLGPLVLGGLSSVFKLARRGVAAGDKEQ